MFLIIDTGTTTTRVYLMSDENRLLAKGVRTAGVRDTVADGDNHRIKEAIVDAFGEVLEKAGARAADVRYTVAAGMISSEIGLVDVPHLLPPVGKKQFAESICVVRDRGIFPLDMPIAFIRGVKTLADGFPFERLDVATVMRAEEVQCIGAMKKAGLSGPVNVMIFSTCTKFVSINGEGEIVSFLTSNSGGYYQMASAGSGGAFGASKDGFVLDADFYRICDLARRFVGESGFLQSSAPLRMMGVFTDSTPMQRDLYLNAAIAADDCRMFQLAERIGFDLHAPFLLVGPVNRCQVYEYLIGRALPANGGIHVIGGQDEMYDTTIQGILDIVAVSDNLKDLV